MPTSAQQKPTAPALELRALSTRPEFVTGGDTHIMTPLPRTVYGPDDWEDASLDEWLES